MFHFNFQNSARGSSTGACSSSDCSYSNPELMFQAGYNKKTHTRLSLSHNSDSSSTNANTAESKMFDDDPDALWRRDKQKYSIPTVCRM